MTRFCQGFLRIRRTAMAMGLLLACWVLAGGSAWADAIRVLGVSLDPATGALVIQCNQPLAQYNQFTTLKLTTPYRYVLDLPDATLAAPATTQPVRRGGIAAIQTSQSRSPFYSAVRVVVTVDSHETLSRLQAQTDGKALVVSGFPSVEAAASPPVASQPAASPTALPTPEPLASPVNPPAGGIPAGQTVISDVFYRDGQIWILSDPTRPERIVVKNRFRLASPERLVVDLDRAALGSRELTGAIHLPPRAAIRSIRVGQFDPQTVRLVIDTPDPDRFHLAFPGADARAMTLAAASDDRDMSRLPKDTAMGMLERITLDADKGGAILRLVASTPAIYRLTRRGEQIQVELLNIAARTGEVGFERAKFPQIAGMRVEPLTVGQPNSKLLLTLDKHTSWEVQARLDETDPRALTVALGPPGQGGGSSAGGGPLVKAPFVARVVVDAGHGGKDQGAERGGILEKDLNLRVAHKLRQALEARGVKVTMTRDTDRFLELRQITEITNRLNPDLFVSVHHNASVNPAIYGIETYYYTPQSRMLADKVHQKLINQVGAPDRGVRKAMFYVIHHTQTPAILCEVGYVSNAQELREVADEARQEAEARAIADGVVAYLHSRLAADAR